MEKEDEIKLCWEKDTGSFLFLCTFLKHILLLKVCLLFLDMVSKEDSIKIVCFHTEIRSGT